MSKNQATPSLTFVVIVYNSESLIRSTLEHLIASIEKAKWSNADILVVNDGSTDGTSAVVKAVMSETKVKVAIVNQSNQGRLMASVNGAKKAKGELVCFIGGRVYMQIGSLLFLKKQLIQHPERRVWNCHIDIPRNKNLQAQFWHVVTFATWHRYLRNPRLLSYNIDDFDYYPKGTGGFVCPRLLLLDNYKKLDSIYSDPKYASDDTTLIRNISKQERIYMSPEYAADYISRSSFSKFMAHTYDRGIFLLDSYMRPGTRLFYPIIGYFLLFVPFLAILFVYPWLLLVVPVALVVLWAGLVFAKVSAEDAFGFCVILPIFAIIYSIGLWKGLVIMLFSKLQKSVS